MTDLIKLTAAPSEAPVSEHTLRRAVQRGELGSFRIAGKIFLDREELGTWVRKNFTPARNPSEREAVA